MNLTVESFQMNKPNKELIDLCRQCPKCYSISYGAIIFNDGESFAQCKNCGYTVENGIVTVVSTKDRHYQQFLERKRKVLKKMLKYRKLTLISLFPYIFSVFIAKNYQFYYFIPFGIFFYLFVILRIKHYSNKLRNIRVEENSIFTS